ncbi:SMP-30/gluconolactonase/LRE family protein [Pleomorphomonas sp. JP5]|uniref:SMP-30/gluconolactonase/LRE family protein n=1 Tax=Pleomorphomonas sp. JP5 TaxID=2942998 RepID=UPI00204459D5|nr:SMP-30/gluconolactonase/LRE family protein [Pleomorphomonas sp. JP5]MCM5559286.1 SMP-30/gluconolactonase/LRE family protein [Pleomorphomonas sp. JP5]
MPTVSVLSNHACHLGEGPSWHPGRAKAFWFDILDRKLLEMGLDDAAPRIHDLPFHATVAARVDDDRHLIASDAGLHLRSIDGGALTELRPFWDERPGTRSNDGAVHPAGALWISTMGWRFEPGFGRIWWYRAGELKPIIDGLTIPNAIAFSPDGRTAYFSDTTEHVIYRIPTDPESGRPTGDRQVFSRVSGGGPDGATVDANGLLWNARWGGHAVDAYDPDGHRVESIALPARQVSCPAFAGPKLDRLLVTSAFEGYDADRRAAEPEAGLTYLVDGPFRGVPPPAVLIG